MEIPKTWIVQKSVAGQSVGSEFTTTDITQSLSNPDIKAAVVLDDMACLDLTHKGTKGKLFRRDPSVYLRKSPPGEVCLGCVFGNSGSSGCVIKDPQMPKQLRVDLDEYTTDY